MRVLKEISLLRFFAQVIFLLLPTMAVVLFILWNSNRYFTILSSQWFSQGIYFGSGLLLSFFLYQFRFRFLPLFAGLVILLVSIYKLLDNYTVGEFDGFFISVRFLIFAYLFSIGWIFGWGLQRIRFFPLLISGILLVLSILLISKTGEITVEKLLSYLTPVVLYTIYMVYTAEALRNVEDTRGAFWWRFGLRLVLFSILNIILFGIVILFMFGEMKARVEEYGGGAKEGENQMLQTQKDQTVKNRESMGLGGNNSRNKNPDPLFCAHIDSYLPGSDIPNPLYLTSYHFTKYDTTTETFERDTTLKFSDEFVPSPGAIPLFFTYKDSSRIKRALGTRNKKTVQVEIYKKRLSADAFIAPSTAWFVQPITVEKDFQKEFTSAYRSKSYVSDLNSAYFIYNSPQPEIVEFQKQRFETLRKAKNYDAVDPEFMRYYTFFPSNGQYRPVKLLADSLAAGKRTTIDKVLAVRDYFLQKNELGEQVYQYSDNPGIPGLPGASKLLYFLFESKKGYCAYYAAATVFLLRSMGIPSRVVTGFLTVDRSDKNKGWYWFYEDQSHGWVQVFFPEYGWIDFDTTVGNDEAEQSPTPDGTPPMQPPDAVMAANAVVRSVDTLRKTSVMEIQRFIFKDVEYEDVNAEKNSDLKVANLWKDSIRVPLGTLRTGDQVMLVSYAEKLKQYSAEKSGIALLKKLSDPLPVDDVYIKDKHEKKKNSEAADDDKNARPLSWYLSLAGILLAALILLIFSIPSLVYQWYKYKMRRSRNSEQKAYYTYRASGFLLNQLQVERGATTPWYYARQVVDPRFGTNFAGFMVLYLKAKYAGQALSAAEAEAVEKFFRPFEQQVKKQFTFGQRALRFLNINQFIQFFYLSEPETKTS